MPDNDAYPQLAWCQACEQYERTNTGCANEGWHVPPLQGEAMAVLDPERPWPSWAVARRARPAKLDLELGTFYDGDVHPWRVAS